MNAKLNNIRKQFAKNLVHLETDLPLIYNTPHIPMALEANEKAHLNEWITANGGFEYAIQYGSYKLWLFVPLAELAYELGDFDSDNEHEQQTYITEHYHVYALLLENFTATIGTTLETFLPITLKKAA